MLQAGLNSSKSNRCRLCGTKHHRQCHHAARQQHASCRFTHLIGSQSHWLNCLSNSVMYVNPLQCKHTALPGTHTAYPASILPCRAGLQPCRWALCHIGQHSCCALSWLCLTEVPKCSRKAGAGWEQTQGGSSGAGSVAQGYHRTAEWVSTNVCSFNAVAQLGLSPQQPCCNSTSRNIPGCATHRVPAQRLIAASIVTLPNGCGLQQFT